LILAACIVAPLAAGVEIHWKGKIVGLESASELGAAPRRAVLAWAAWAGEARYRMDLSDDGLVLLLTPEESALHGAHLELASRVVAHFEEHLPAPEESAPAPASAQKDAQEKEEPDELPEDPEDDIPFPWEGRTGDVSEWSFEYTWGVAEVIPDTETVAFLVLRDEDDYARALAALAARHEFLAAWKETALNSTGFTLEYPLTGAYVLNAEGQEEWSPEAELVNRLSQLLVLRRFGRQPYWLAQGFAWCAETNLRGGIYCFPYRDEFVFAVEHFDWDEDLERRFGELGMKKLSLNDFASWRRGGYDDQKARFSWGVCHFLLEEHPGALPRAMEDLRLVALAEGRKDNGDGTWERIADYEVPLERQRDVLEARAGAKLWTEVVAYFRK
jgi:hypothetical protein